jgi:hypothetical protein
MAILFESNSENPEEFNFDGEVITNFGRVIISETIEDAHESNLS